MAPPRAAPASAAAALLLAASATAASATTLTLHLFDTAKYPRALCNDGTPSGVYRRPSPSGKSNVWVVFQEGGGWCWDKKTCDGRESKLRSSANWSHTMSMEGVFASTDARLADAELVFVPYCTSDAHAGSVLAADSPLGLNFLGRDVVTAVFDDLVAGGMGSRPGTQVLYGGCSAGALRASSQTTPGPASAASASAPTSAARASSSKQSS